jgi:hypothetical protein
MAQNQALVEISNKTAHARGINLNTFIIELIQFNIHFKTILVTKLWLFYKST